MANPELVKRMKAFGKRLRASRIAAGYDTAEDLVRNLDDCKSPTYRQWERGDAMPPINYLERICDLVNKSADFLLFGRTAKN